MGVAATEWTVVGILRKPVALTISTNWLLTNFALKWVLQDVVAYTTDQLGEKSSHISLVIYVVLFVVVALLLL